MQGYEALGERAQVTAFASTHPAFSLQEIRLPIRQLPSPDYYLMPRRLLRGSVGKELWDRLGLDYLVGLEGALAGFDVVNALETVPACTLQAARARLRYPRLRLVTTCWETIPFLQDEHPRTRRRKRFVQRYVDLYLAMTQRARDALLLEGVAPHKIRVQYPCIDLTRFRPLPRREQHDFDLWQRPGALRVLFVGSITASKGIRDYLRAAALVSAMPFWRDRVEFGLVGRGDLAPILPLMMASLGLQESVRYLPHVPYASMPDLYASTDVFVLPSIATTSWEEQFGMVLAESMACGKAVVTTLSGAIPEVVGDAAVLVPPSDPDALARVLDDLLRDEARRAAMGQAAAARARELFDPTAFAAALLRLYEDALAL